MRCKNPRPGIKRHDPVIEGSDTWNLLHKQNIYDLRLYDYAQQLFEVMSLSGKFLKLYLIL